MPFIDPTGTRQQPHRPGCHRPGCPAEPQFESLPRGCAPGRRCTYDLEDPLIGSHISAFGKWNVNGGKLFSIQNMNLPPLKP